MSSHVTCCGVLNIFVYSDQCRTVFKDHGRTDRLAATATVLEIICDSGEWRFRDAHGSSFATAAPAGASSCQTRPSSTPELPRLGRERIRASVSAT